MKKEIATPACRNTGTSVCRHAPFGRRNDKSGTMTQPLEEDGKVFFPLFFDQLSFGHELFMNGFLLSDPFRIIKA
jgi:hypothetical protein